LILAHYISCDTIKKLEELKKIAKSKSEGQLCEDSHNKFQNKICIGQNHIKQGTKIWIKEKILNLGIYYIIII
jgi:hypothetical protein